MATPVVGTSAADAGCGRELDAAQGLGGNDTLNGQRLPTPSTAAPAASSLSGGNGNDTYIVDSAKDVIADIGGTDDRIQASISIDLNAAAYFAIDHVTLTGTAALNATGNDNGNLLIGNAGANILDGKGGEDQLIGGAGNDTYVVDDPVDHEFENPGEGTDQVNSSVGHTLGANVENLTLIGTGNDFGEGNDLANKITGNDGDNRLEGFDGNDTMTGNGQRHADGRPRGRQHDRRHGRR